MDYKDILSQITADVNKRTNDILEQSQHTIDSILDRKNPKAQSEDATKSGGIVRLIRDSRLDEASKAKIGTFEQLYSGTYVADSKVPMYGYDDLDYASLVNLLASALEIELNLSLYQLIRKDAGIDIPKFIGKDAEKKEIFVGDKTINVGKASQMYGALMSLFFKFKGTVTKAVGDSSKFLNSLSNVVETRNRANHKNMIGRDEFISFYIGYSDLFNTFITRLLDLKESLRNARVEYSYMTYGERVKYDVQDDDYIRGLKDLSPDEKHVGGQSGIIFTDSRKLAFKYYGEDRSKYNGEIYSYSVMIRRVLNDYIEKLQAHGIAYSLLDLGSGKYDYILEERKDISAYLDILEDYCKKNDITSDNPGYLFMIGGHDVIPMARLHNPGQDPENEAIDSNCLDNTVDTDLPYAYPIQAIRFTSKGELSLDALSGSIGSPRFYVGRLPLENGFMKTSFEEDICAYLQRSLSSFADGGISINAPLMTTCRNAMDVGAYMIEDIPVVTHEDSPEDLATPNMITSPSLAFNTDPKGRYEQNGTQTFSSKIARSDMLIFLLHGSGAPSSSYYYGDYMDEQLGRIQPIAFGPDLFAAGTIKSVATVSCFGAKFIDYDRKNSTLLSALYRDTLCFLGSSRSAFGDFDNSLARIREETGKSIPRYSVRMMHYYLHLLFSGIPAGESLSRARVKYMNGVTSEEYPEGIPLGMTTILEFNFFGDPALYLQPRISISELYAKTPESLLNYRCDGDAWTMDYEPVDLPGSGNRGGLRDSVRKLVDKGFEQIHAQITDKLYNEWGIPPRELYSVNKYSSKGGKSGYSLRYRHLDGAVYTDTIVRTDVQGKIVDLYHTY